MSFRASCPWIILVQRWKMTLVQGGIMKSSYLLHLDNSYTDSTFRRKVEYIKYNFGALIHNTKKDKDVCVLEIGPGRGEFVKYLNDNEIKNIDIVDNDKEVLNFVKEKFYVTNAFLSGNLTSINNDLRKYSVIILVQLLEHLPPKVYFSFIKTLYSKLKPNGSILIVVPNANNPLGLVERYGDLQHENSFTEQSLIDLVHGSGIDNYNVEIKAYSIPPTDILNVIRIMLQKVLHFFILAIMIINGGTYFKIMTPNIALIIRKT